MQERLRFFLNHAGRGDPEKLTAIANDLTALVYLLRPKAVVEVVPGYIDHDKNFQLRGGWDAWCRDIAYRVDEITRRPVYDFVIIPAMGGEQGLGDFRLGQAQGLITWFMLKREPAPGGNPCGVRAYFPDGETRAAQWQHVSHAWRAEPHDFKHGWRVA